jgi:hypothetical protein
LIHSIRSESLFLIQRISRWSFSARVQTKDGINVGSQVISHPKPVELRQPIPIDSYVRRAKIASSREVQRSAPKPSAPKPFIVQPSSTAIKTASDSIESELGCVRGTRLAIGLEFALVLCLYGIWHLLHLVR